MAKQRRRQQQPQQPLQFGQGAPAPQPGVAGAANTAWPQALATGMATAAQQAIGLTKTLDAAQQANLRARLSGLAMAESLQQQAQRWAGLGRAQKDAALDQVLASRATEEAAAKADRLTQSTRATTYAYAAFSGGLLAWVRAGMSGTTVGEQLSFQQSQLSQQIASIFLPVIQRYIDALQRIVQWFRNLSGAQQEQLMRWSLFTVGLLGSVTVIPRLTGALGTLGMTLKGLFIANPFAALTASIVGLMAQTEEGRDSLARMGQAMTDAFGAVADLLGGPLAETLAGLANFISSQPGQWLAGGTVAVSVLYRIAAAGQGSLTTFLGWGTALGAAVLLVGGIATALAGASRQAKQTFTDITAALRAGQITQTQAREQVKVRAEQAAAEAEEAFRKTYGTPDRMKEDFLRRTLGVGTAEEAGQRAREEAQRRGGEDITRGGRGRQDVTRTGGGTEDARATLRRLEAASLRAGGDPAQKTADNTTDLARMLRDMQEMMRRATGIFDDREKTPKAD